MQVCGRSGLFYSCCFGDGPALGILYISAQMSALQKSFLFTLPRWATSAPPNGRVLFCLARSELFSHTWQRAHSSSAGMERDVGGERPGTAGVFSARLLLCLSTGRDGICLW